MNLKKSLTDCFETSETNEINETNGTNKSSEQGKQNRSIEYKKYNGKSNGGPKQALCQKGKKNIASNHIKNILYVDLDSFDLTRVIVRPEVTFSRSIKFNRSKQSMIRYEILYQYIDPNEPDTTNGTNRLIDKLNLFCNGIGLNQNRRGVRINSYNSCNLPLNRYKDPYDKLNSVMKGIRDYVVKYMITQNNNIEAMRAMETKESNIYIQMMNRGQMCKIIKLGSKSENNLNIDVPSIEEFNALLTDYRYNKKNSDSYYKTDLIISFKSCVYGDPDKKISFKPYVKIMEMHYNKASCIPEINLEDLIIMTDNVLVL